MDNLELWEKVHKTDPAITKRTRIGGNTITAIDPQFQRKAATEQFGPFGIGWGVGDEAWSYLDIGDTKLCHYTATLWYKLNDEQGSFPINANVKVAYKTQGENSYIKVDDEFAKKVQTNAITKGLSFLGFNSDVFEGKFDDNKYVQARKAEEAEGNPTPQDTQSGSKQQSQSTGNDIDNYIANMGELLGKKTFVSILASEERSLKELAVMTDADKKKIAKLMKAAYDENVEAKFNKTKNQNLAELKKDMRP